MHTSAYLLSRGYTAKSVADASKSIQPFCKISKQAPVPNEELLGILSGASSRDTITTVNILIYCGHRFLGDVHQGGR